MARMIPAQIANITGSHAEETLFREFARQLSHDYTVLHSVGWLNRPRGGSYEKDEADFVIVHPQRGVLVIEAKGGKIFGNTADRDWVSEDRFGGRHTITNPIAQVERNMYALREKLGEHPATSRFHYVLSRGIAFPDVITRDAQFGVNFDRSMLIDSSNLNDIRSAVDRLFQPLDSKDWLSPAAIDAVVDLLATPVVIEHLGLLNEVKQDEQTILRLTEQQYLLLSYLRSIRQGAINGCAGSGKTMLAIEKARQLAEEGLDVLLTCYNKALAAWIREGVARHHSPAMKHITVYHYHDLARILTEQAGVTLHGRFQEKDFWEETLPNLFADAIPNIETRFDAIVADEGQDFATEWWFTLQQLLRDPENGIVYIFQDARQALYRDPEELPVPVLPGELTNNCRTTAAIHKQGIVYVAGDPKPEALGPQGRSVEHVDISGNTMLKAVQQVLARLIDQEGFTTDQIVILTPAGEARSALKQGLKLGNRRLTRGDRETPNDVRVSTIHSFKGLESPIIILAEMDMIPPYVQHPDNFCYVALTRAKHHLVVIGELPVPRSLVEASAR